MYTYADYLLAVKQKILGNFEARNRVLKSYQLMLDFYGMQLIKSSSRHSGDESSTHASDTPDPETLEGERSIKQSDTEESKERRLDGNTIDDSGDDVEDSCEESEHGGSNEMDTHTDEAPVGERCEAQWYSGEIERSLQWRARFSHLNRYGHLLENLFLLNTAYH